MDSPQSATVTLLGRFSLVVGGQECDGFDGRRVQELLAYLLINHGRPCHREVLADRLWGDGCTAGRKQLRHALWQLQTALGEAGVEPILDIGHEWVSVVLGSAVGVDVDVLGIERAQECASGLAGEELVGTTVEILQGAVDLYRGDLLPACYEDWCVIERERYRTIHLALLDKLMAHAEATSRFEEGLAYGELVLRHDRASERTHRRLMRMRYLSGDRSGALRQFELCARALREELDVDPAPATTRVGHVIRRGESLESDDAPTGASAAPSARDRVVDRLRRLRTVLAEASACTVEALVALECDAVHEPRRQGDGEQTL